MSQRHLSLAVVLTSGLFQFTCGSPETGSDLFAAGNFQQADFESTKSAREHYVSLHLKSFAELDVLTRLVSIDWRLGLDIKAYASSHELLSLTQAGFAYKELEHPGKNPEAVMGLRLGAKSWAAYPTYSEYEEAMHLWAEDYPDLCRLVDLGPTTSGLRPHRLWVLVISDNPSAREDEPQVFLSSSMHGDETVGAVVLLKFIDELLNNYSSDPELTRLVNETEIWINPLANPDGTYFGGDDTVADAVRYYVGPGGNYVGVDPNRNFPRPSGISPTLWRETVAMIELAKSERFVLSANIHGGAEVINYPWEHKAKRHTDDAWWQVVSRNYADKAQQDGPSWYMQDLDNGVTNGWDWYPVYGSRQDYMTYFQGGRELTIEISAIKNPPAKDLPVFWTANRSALVQFVSASLSGIRGRVVDDLGNPLAATVTLLEHDESEDQSSVATDPRLGNFHRLVLPGTYDVEIQAEGFDSQVFSGVKVNEGAATRLEVVLSQPHLPPPPPTEPTVMINEVLADPPAGMDVNGDGSASVITDEFVELVNFGDQIIDLSGWGISDSAFWRKKLLRYTFPEGSSVGPYSALVIWGSDGLLGLSNAGDEVFLVLGEEIIDSVLYTAEGGQNASLNRAQDGDVSSELVLHPTLQNGLPYSPGLKSDGTPF